MVIYLFQLTIYNLILFHLYLYYLIQSGFLKNCPSKMLTLFLVLYYNKNYILYYVHIDYFLNYFKVNFWRDLNIFIVYTFVGQITMNLISITFHFHCTFNAFIIF
jgi:hypothetical protein